MRIHTTMAVLATSLLFAACNKEGPEGPAGPVGPQGNANVRSETFTVSPGNWNTIPGGWAFNRSAPVVTEAVANTGSVLVYMKTGTQWLAVPLTFGGVTIGYAYGSGQVQVEYYASAAPDQTTEWKIVAIAGSAMVGDGVDVTDYKVLQAHFGLED